MIRVFIGLGTNLGDRQQNLEGAREALTQKLEILRESSVYETVPWGYLDQTAFFKPGVEAQTELTPLKLLSFL